MRQKNKILLTAASLLLMAGCSKPEETVGTVPSSVLLKAPEVDTENSVIRLRAVYNGDDKAVKDAEFTMTDIQGGGKAFLYPAAGGAAEKPKVQSPDSP